MEQLKIQLRTRNKNLKTDFHWFKILKDIIINCKDSNKEKCPLPCKLFDLRSM